MNPVLTESSKRYEYMIIFDGCSSDIEAGEAKRMSILNHYGEDGWELVSVCAPVKTYKGDSFCYYFKRPA
jgi:hypothetical protein